MACCGKTTRVSTRDTPFIIGDPTETVMRARVTVSIEGLKAGAIGWFSGTTVPILVQRAVLVPVD